MLMISRLLIICCILVLSCSIPLSFNKNKEHSNIKSYSYVFSGKSEEEFDIQFYASVPYNYFIFTKSNNRFIAEVAFSLTVTDLNSNTQVYNCSWSENIEEKFYEDTRDIGKFLLTSQTFSQPVGDYRIFLSVQDLDSKHQWNIIQSVCVNKIDLFSNLIPLIKFDDSLLFVGQRIKEDVDTIFCKFQVSKDVIDEDISYSVSFAEEILLSDTLKSTEIEVNDYLLLPIPLEDDWSGRLKIKLKLLDKAKETFVIVKRNGMDKYLTNIEEAVEIVSLIMADEEIKSLKKLSPMKQKMFIMQYWEKRDPTEGTDTNELMEEFYNRVEVANRRFSTFSTGWKTDRGKVYIVHGPPDNVETTRRGSSAVYQIWSYTDGRQFIFKDNGLGEFRQIQGVW